MMPVQKHDGLPVSGFKFPVDAFSFCFHLGHQIVITLDVGATRRANLHEGELADEGRIFFEETLDAYEALGKTLGVIDAIDANSEIKSLDTKFLQQLRLTNEIILLATIAGAGCFKVHTDWEWLYLGQMAGAHCGGRGPVNPALEGAIHGFQKIMTVRLNVEADEVSPEQAFEQFRLPGADTKCLGIWPRDVPEDGDTRVVSRSCLINLGSSAKW